MKAPFLMGIVNVTPDSFSDGGLYFQHAHALKHARQLVEEGADILDIGGESTRPGSEGVSEEEELRRILPVIETLASTVSVPLSIDTSKPMVALKALESGARFINDVTGLKDPLMREIAADKKCDLCLMHMQGTPKTMQQSLTDNEEIVSDLLHWFERRLEEVSKEGISLDKVYIDPGIGFGKTPQDNLTLIKNIHVFRKLGVKVLVGLSRKSFICNILNKKDIDLLSTTVAMNTLALVAQVDMIRVHDVQTHRNAIDLVQACLNSPEYSEVVPMN